MPYHIDEENSELVFEVREGNKLVIKLKSNTGGGGSDIYLIKTGDETTPTEKNTFSSLRILKEIEQLHETILQEVGSYLSVWEIKQAENGEKYISTKYDVVTEKGITAYASGIKDAGSIVDGIPFDNKTIWFNPETGVVEVIGGTGGGSFDSSKMWELLLSDTDEQINISHLSDALSGYATEEELRKKWTQDDNKISNWDTAFSWGDHSKSGYAHLANEETFSDIKHFTQGLTVGEGKHKLYEKDGVVYLDGDLAVTGGLTAYALGDTDISTIMDGVVVDGTTIKKENGQLVVIVGSGSSFDKSAMWAALSDDTTEQINKSHLTTALSGYATTSQLNTKWTQDNTKISHWDEAYNLRHSHSNKSVLDGITSGKVSNWDTAYSWGNHANSGYAKQTSLDAVSSKLNDFLEGSDTDTIINKWKELESFLSGMTESDNLADILSTKADKSFVTSELTKYVTLATSQTISGAKTFTSLLTTAAIKAKGDINTPNVRTSDSVYINGIRLYKSPEGNLILDGNLLVTGGVTAYSDGSSSGGSSGGIDVDLLWEILGGTGIQQINKTHLTDALNGYATQSWVTSQNYLKSVSIATISDLNSSWDALLKAAPSVYVTRHPTISEVTNKQNIIIKLNGGTTEGTNQFTYNATAAKTINITPSGIGAAASSHNHSWANITSGKPTTLSGYGITDAYTKTEADNKYLLKTSYTAADVLSKLKTVDGSGSGLDADLLDGKHLSDLVPLKSQYGLHSSGTRPYNYMYLCRIANTKGYSTLRLNLSLKARFSQSDLYIAIECGKHTTSTTVHIRKCNTNISPANLYYKTITEGSYVYVDLYMDWGAWNAGGYVLTNVGVDGILSHTHKGILIDSLPSGYVTIRDIEYKVNVNSATKLQTARQINGTNFDGTANITTAKWGTARTITLGSYLSGSVSLDGSANVTLNANVIGLTSQGRKTAISGTTIPSSGVRLYEVYNNGYPTTYGNLLSIKGGGSGELLLAWKNTNRIYYRSKSDVQTEKWMDWSTVAFLTDNVASATKLQTSRTLWGQNFDGTANVSGNMTGVGSISASGDIITSKSMRTTDMYINGVRVYKPQDKVLKIEGNLLVTGGITQYSIDSGDYPNIEDIVSDAIKVDNISVKKDNGIIKSCSLNLNGYYTGGEEKPINLGGAMFKVTMLRNTTMGLTSDSYWNDVIWISSYGGTDVANSQILAFSKNGMKRIYHARQSFSSGSYGGFDTIAYISDTVAAATKLETSRMIFGQSFDGTQDIDGDITTSGSILNASDARNKNILDTINCISLDNIVSLPIIKFRWNNRAFKDDGRTRYGTIAQEVQKILPELVYDRDNSLYMDYAVAGAIFSISVAKSLKGTKSEVERLKERVRILEEMLNIKQNGYEEVNTLAN